MLIWNAPWALATFIAFCNISFRKENYKISRILRHGLNREIHCSLLIFLNEATAFHKPESWFFDVGFLIPEFMALQRWFFLVFSHELYFLFLTSKDESYLYPDIYVIIYKSDLH